jgi:DivIVA domain-containing protein
VSVRRYGVTKSVIVKIFDRENSGYTVRKFHADPGKGYSADEVDRFLDALATDLEKRFPEDEFGMVEVAPSVFNFVWRGKRQPQTGPERVSP